MSERSARFYFANLAADVMRCVNAAERQDESRYQSSLARARTTLRHLQPIRGAYEEGLLLLRALAFAKEEHALAPFAQNVNRLTLELIS